MSKYMLLVDKQIRFEDVQTLEIGDEFYEDSGYGSIIKGVAVTTPKVKGDQVTWDAMVHFFNGVERKFSPESDKCSYLITKGFEHYGPKLYKSFVIFDRESQKVVEFDN